MKKNSHYLNLAKKTRLNIIHTARRVGGVHFGGCFSVVEILISYYSQIVNQETKFKDFIKNNTLVLSKGHCGLAVYSLLEAINAISKESFNSYCMEGGDYMGHIKEDLDLGIGWSTGSLGHGLSASMGIAHSEKLKNKTHHVTCILGDGEMNEGSVWEALIHLGNYENLNLTVLLDNNQFISLGRTSDIRPIEPIEKKIRGFNVRYIEVDGHDVSSLINSINLSRIELTPCFINCKTIKGKGLSISEGVSEWHAKRASEEQLDAMEKELK